MSSNAPSSSSSQIPLGESKPESNSFPQFSKLPHEIRLSIWQFALPGPRIVQIEYRTLAETCKHILRHVRSDRVVPNRCIKSQLNKRATSCEEKEDTREELELSKQIRNLRHGRSSAFSSRTPIPALILTCRESHKVASKVYLRSFSGDLGSLPQIYFNFELDTLYFSGASFEQVGITIIQALEIFLPDELTKVRYLAISVGLLSPRQGHHGLNQWLADFLDRFGHVEKLTLIGNSANEIEEVEDWSHVDFLRPVHVGKALGIFENPQQFLGQDAVVLPGPDFHESYYSLSKGTLEVEQQHHPRRHGSWEAPVIERKVASSVVSTRKFQELKKEFEKRSGCIVVMEHA